jgi:hypothetical protein
VTSFGDAFSRCGAHLSLLAFVAAMSCAIQHFLKAGVGRGGPISFNPEGLFVLIRRAFTTPVPNRWIGTLLIVAGMFLVGQK